MSDLRATRLAPLLLALVALIVPVLLLVAAPAGAQDAGGEVLVGTLDYDDAEGNEVPVEGAALSVVDAAGDEVATGSSDEEGRFEIELPGPGQYTVTLDVATLPGGVSLRDADRATSTFQMSPNQQRNLLFPLVEGESGGGGGGVSRLDRLPQLLFLGIRFGLIIAMSAVGLSLIFGTTGLVNFAHGELVTLGALVAYFLNAIVGLHLAIAGPLAVVVCGLIGGSIDVGFWRPLRARGTSLTAMLVVSIGVSLAVRYVYLYQFGGRTRPFDQYAIQTNNFEVLGITMVPKDLWIIGISVALLVLVAIGLQATRIGKATRAVADNKDLAESSGIDVDRVILVVWAFGGALAAVGGIFLGLTEQVSWQGGFQLLLLMFAGVTLGGLGTAYGALVGSLVVGVAVQVSTLFIASELKNVAALALLVLILLVRPQGILGQKERVG